MWISKPTDPKRSARLTARMRPDLKAWLLERARSEKRSGADILEALVEAAMRGTQLTATDEDRR